MSSVPSSTKKIFLPSQAQLFDRQNGILTSMISSDQHSPDPSSVSTTRLIGPRPFYRSQLTPDPQNPSTQLQRRYSVHQINGLSNQEFPSSTTPMHPQYRSTTNPKRALISVSSSQSPMITIAAAGGAPTRSEIRLSSSPKPNHSQLREICISRPDSPSISINRTATNGSSGAFRISLGTPGNTTQRSPHGRTSPSFYPMEKPRDSLDNRYTSNVVSHRFTPSMAYTSSINNTYDRSSSNDVDRLRKPSNDSNSIGLCARCNDEIIGEENGLVAMDRMYHVSCFTCTMCGCRLRGMHFYSMENKPYCEPCYINSLEKCIICTQPITDRILRATGKPYHPRCFSCITCQKSLDGVPFTVDANMQIHCIECFHERFAPRCYACHRPILPVAGQEETVRVVALDRSYHLDCYRCEHCQVHFTSEQGCHPIDEHIFCLQCNRLYSNTMLGHA